MGDVIKVSSIAVCLIAAIAGPSALVGSKIIQQQAIERGYALYCPDNGGFVWKGECE